MKIQSFEVSHLRIPLKKKYTLSKVIGSRKDTDVILLKVHTGQGITGYGEADPHVPFTEESAESVCSCIVGYLAPVLIGRDPMDLDGINSAMDHAVKLNLMAKGAVDMACHDIAGKINGLPVHHMLGGLKRESIPLVWSVGNDRPP